MFSKLVILVVAIASLIYLAVFLSDKDKKSKIEQFNESAVDKTLLSTVYQHAGIERCDALYADIASRLEMREEMTEQALQTMDSFVLGYRMRELIPKDQNRHVEMLRQGKKKCYMLFDSNNNAIDPALSFNSCSSANPIFQGVDFINNVYIDNSEDISHALPYTKCVIDIDSNNVNATTLNDFWSGMGQAQCTAYHSTASNELRRIVNTFTMCNNELKAFKTLTPQYVQCLSNQARLQAELSHSINLYTISNCAFAGGCTTDGSLPTMEMNFAQLQSAISLTTTQVAQLNTSIANIQTQLRTRERELNDLNISYNALSNDYIRCINVDLPETTSRLEEQVGETMRLTNTSNLLAQQYRICSSNLNAKQIEYNTLITETNMARALYDGSNSRLVSCLGENDTLNQTIATLRDQLNKLESASNECISSMVMRTAEHQALTKEVKVLEDALEYWKRMCKFDQRAAVQLNIETINSLRESATSYTRTYCGNDRVEAEEVADLIQKKFDAIGKISTQTTCEEKKRFQCCKQRNNSYF